eukprot:TRINITY_DN30297_c0_g1_i1.p2 TRINITY_DN30297_c0_g1~~TRINITY_DN30297_c0_g1_i1.p2  ORF type:complete len:105 (+),score=30.73 TRINITY_DN30297_c0_g1_i1:113-427(+)
MFFFFKQKTAYEMLRSLVGSEMCIRDRTQLEELARLHDGAPQARTTQPRSQYGCPTPRMHTSCGNRQRSMIMRADSSLAGVWPACVLMLKSMNLSNVTFESNSS